MKMLSSELKAAIDAQATRFGLAELASDDSDSFCELVRSRFVVAGRASWWWQDLTQEAVSLVYGEEDGLAVLAELLPSDDVVLVPTDDERPPWPSYRGSRDAVTFMLRELPYFEYFVASADGNWVVFDTHHNVIVVTGSLVAAARLLGAE